MRTLSKSAGAAPYGNKIRANVRRLYGGKINTFTFVDEMVSTIRDGLTEAFEAGAREVGVLPSELTQDEVGALNREISGELSHIYSFAADIAARSNGLPGLLSRAGMWERKYSEVRSLAMVMAGKDKKLKWVVDRNKESCPDCIYLNGRVHRASTWARYGVRPRMRSLRCGGWRCGCSFVVTDEPVTPGRPPAFWP